MTPPHPARPARDRPAPDREANQADEDSGRGPSRMSRRTFLAGGAAAAAGGAGVLLAACTGSNRITSLATQHDHSPTSGSAALTPSGGTSATAGEPPSSDWTGGDLNAGLDVTTSSARLPPHFQVALPIPVVLNPVSSGDTDHYRITQIPAAVEILPGYSTPIWSYNGPFRAQP